MSNTQNSLPPSVSIVMPIHNRVDLLRLSLPPLLEQTYPRERYEIILVDDGSTDNVAEQARILVQGWTGQFRLLSKSNGGPASARNAGVHASNADIIAFIDSDCVAEPDWLETVVGAMLHQGVAGIGAPIVNEQCGKWVARYLEAMNFYRHRVRDGKVDYLITGNVAFLRSALTSVDGFVEQPNVWVEDVDLSFRLTSAGHKLGVVEKGAVRHYGSPRSVRGFAKNLFRYGAGNYILSARWQNRRKPYFELVRHMGAVILSPYIALSRARTFGLGQSLSFIPLIIVEHTAFCLGMIGAMLRRLIIQVRAN